MKRRKRRRSNKSNLLLHEVKRHRAYYLQSKIVSERTLQRINKRQKLDEDEEEKLEFIEEEEEEEQQIKVVALGGQMSSSILSSEQNRIRENIAKNKQDIKGYFFICLFVRFTCCQ